jgi:hypothetical protein
MDGMFHALARGIRRRVDDEHFRAEIQKLDRVIAAEAE